MELPLTPLEFARRTRKLYPNREAVVDGELRVRPMREVIRRVQERMKRYIPSGVSLADELIADRRREAADE